MSFCVRVRRFYLYLTLTVFGTEGVLSKGFVEPVHTSTVGILNGSSNITRRQQQSIIILNRLNNDK